PRTAARSGTGNRRWALAVSAQARRRDARQGIARLVCARRSHRLRDAVFPGQSPAGRRDDHSCRFARVLPCVVCLLDAIEAREIKLQLTSCYLSIASLVALNSLPGFHSGNLSACATR